MPISAGERAWKTPPCYGDALGPQLAKRVPMRSPLCCSVAAV